QPGIGRFLQPDPLSLDAGDQNIYRYCNNDPINGSDPMGLDDGEFNFSLDYGYGQSPSSLNLGDDPLGFGGGSSGGDWSGYMSQVAGGFFVDGAWNMLTGLWDMATHLSTTAHSLKDAASRPSQ